MGNSTSSSPDDFYNDGVGVLIRKPGTYLALYTVQVPSGTPLTTTFALQMNNQNIPGMVVGVDHKSSSGSTVYSAQGILNAPENEEWLKTAYADYRDGLKDYYGSVEGVAWEAAFFWECVYSADENGIIRSDLDTALVRQSVDNALGSFYEAESGAQPGDEMGDAEAEPGTSQAQPVEEAPRPQQIEEGEAPIEPAPGDTGGVQEAQSLYEEILARKNDILEIAKTGLIGQETGQQ